MRFLGLVLVLAGYTVGYFLGYQGKSFSEMRTRLAQLTNLPGLAPPAASSSSSAAPAVVTPGGKVTAGSSTSAPGRPFNPRGNLGSL